MGLTADDYRELCQNLLPSGPAWPRESDAFVTRLLDAWAQELARIDARVDALIEEADPRTTSELLGDWEREYGLPDECLTRTTTLLPGYFALNNNSLRSFARASTATYFDASGVMQTAPANIPRFDYEPVTHSALGLLIEAGSTNLMLQSQSLDDAAWAKLNATVTQDAAVAPNGTLSADLLIDSATSAEHRVTQIFAGDLSVARSSSVYVKAGSGGLGMLLALYDTSNFSNFVRCVFVNTGGVFSASTPASGGAGSSASASVVYVGGGWYRLSISGIVNSGLTSGNIRANFNLFGSGATATGIYAGTGAAGNFLWGGQTEVGSTTSYIPTTNSAAARSADAAVVEVDPTIAERRARLRQKVAFQGGQSRQYFIDFLAALGYPGATITEYKPFKANSKCNASLNQGGWRYAWRISVPAAADAKRFNAVSRCDEPLTAFGDPGLACILAKYKPAHTILYIGYGEA